MEPEKLRIFLKVAQCGSFSKAAAELFISHSTVSRAVTSLETELRVKLVERDNSVHGLTPAGERLRERARELLALTEEIVSEIRGMSETNE